MTYSAEQNDGLVRLVRRTRSQDTTWWILSPWRIVCLLGGRTPLLGRRTALLGRRTTLLGRRTALLGRLAALLGTGRTWLTYCATLRTQRERTGPSGAPGARTGARTGAGRPRVGPRW